MTFIKYRWVEISFRYIYGILKKIHNNKKLIVTIFNSYIVALVSIIFNMLIINQQTGEIRIEYVIIYCSNKKKKNKNVCTIYLEMCRFVTLEYQLPNFFNAIILLCFLWSLSATSISYKWNMICSLWIQCVLFSAFKRNVCRLQ